MFVKLTPAPNAPLIFNRILGGFWFIRFRIFIVFAVSQTFFLQILLHRFAVAFGAARRAAGIARF